jgi:protein gp37
VAEKSKIGWTDCTYNHWIGCTKVSAACKNCYAAVSTPARTLRASGHETWGAGAPRKRTKTEKDVRRWNKLAGEGYFRSCAACGKREFRKWSYTLPPGGLSCCTTKDCLALPESESDVERPRVFCSSLSDWLDDEVPIEWLAELLDLIRTTPNLDWLLLTKRPENFRPRLQRILDLMGKHLTLEEAYLRMFIELMLNGRATATYTAPEVGRENYWIGATVEDKPNRKRIEDLRKIPASVRFLSCEPLLEDLGEIGEWAEPQDGGRYYIEGIHWVICGGESGKAARPMRLDWARSLRDQCHAARVPFFFKQWGEWLPAGQVPTLVLPDSPWVKEGADIPFLEGSYRIGTKHSGNRLDGRKWEQFPERGAR